MQNMALWPSMENMTFRDFITFVIDFKGVRFFCQNSFHGFLKHRKHMTFMTLNGPIDDSQCLALCKRRFCWCRFCPSISSSMLQVLLPDDKYTLCVSNTEMNHVPNISNKIELNYMTFLFLYTNMYGVRAVLCSKQNLCIMIHFWRFMLSNTRATRHN